MKINYIFKHRRDDDIQVESFDIEYIEAYGNNVLDFIEGMRKDGYQLIKRETSE